MQRNCDYCGKPYEAKRTTSRFCKDSCRVQNNQRGGGVTSLSTAKPAEQPTVIPAEQPLVAAVGAELAAAERLHTSLGQQALYLATRIAAASFDTGSSIASMNRELRETMLRALDGVKVADDPLDEVARRRDAKRLSG